MALLGLTGAWDTAAVVDLVEAHDRARCDGEVVPTVDELRGAQTPEAVQRCEGVTPS
jgi:hypothetical protein